MLGGVSVELVHLGSLYHDDVIDEAETRRTVPSVNARWGNLTAILAGDYLLAKASEIAASLGTEVAGLLAATIGRLCEGEVAELQTAFDVQPDARPPTWRRSRARRRRCSPPPAVSAASSAGSRGPTSTRCTRFGESYGVAFQIVDDVLDVVADAAELGKPAGPRPRRGRLHAARAACPRAGGGRRAAAVSSVACCPTTNASGRADLVRSNGAVAEAMDEARRWSAVAVDALAPFAGSPAATWLAEAATGLFDRVSY